ncbi:sugar phosphate isomerase/epimerase family protein [Candidatus Latescibacterota bacterium]
MKKKISRRKAISAGAVSAAALMNAHPESIDASTLKDVWGADFLTQWCPPKNFKRDLTPGPTPVRLSCEPYKMRMPKTGESFGDVVKIIRDKGYTACESRAVGYENITDSQIREMKAALREYDVEFYGIHIVVNIIDPDPAQARANQIQVARAAELAERFGLKFILTHAGGRSPKGLAVPHPDNWSKEAWEMSVNALKQILKDTSGCKTCLAVEAVNSWSVNNPFAHVQLKKDVGDDRLKVALDPANMLYAGTFFRTTELITKCFDLHGEDIMYGHAKDKYWTTMMPSIVNAVLGEGNGPYDYETYLTRLSRMKYPRCLLIEHLNEDQYPPSRQFLLDTAKKAGVKIYGET